MEAFSTEYRLVTYRVLSDGAEERIDPVSIPIIVAIVSAIFGFLFGNISGWIAAKRDRRKLVQERYTQQYITEGIDPLLSYFVHKCHLSAILRGFIIELATLPSAFRGSVFSHKLARHQHESVGGCGLPKCFAVLCHKVCRNNEKSSTGSTGRAIQIFIREAKRRRSDDILPLVWLYKPFTSSL